MNASKKSYDATLDIATKNGEHWTSHDLDFVQAFDGEVSDEEIAFALSRTLYAIWSIKSVLTERRERADAHVAHALPYDDGFADIGAWERSFDA
jgi:hypothetical protein